MTYRLKDVVPWGRSFDEYIAMFALTPCDLEKRILACGDGPASFNSFVTRAGGRVVSVDPLYRFKGPQIRARVAETKEQVLGQVRANRSQFVWSSIKSAEHLERVRANAMNQFLDDYDLGRAQGRYIAAALPNLPFTDASFDSAICSHVLFLYSDHLTGAFHVASIRDMLRVADEVRVFPVLELGGSRSAHLTSVVRYFEGTECSVRIVPVQYEFQRGGNEMLVVKRQESSTEGGRSHDSWPLRSRS